MLTSRALPTSIPRPRLCFHSPALPSPSQPSPSPSQRQSPTCGEGGLAVPAVDGGIPEGRKAGVQAVQLCPQRLWRGARLPLLPPPLLAHLCRARCLGCLPHCTAQQKQTKRSERESPQALCSTWPHRPPKQANKQQILLTATQAIPRRTAAGAFITPLPTTIAASPAAFCACKASTSSDSSPSSPAASCARPL